MEYTTCARLECSACTHTWYEEFPDGHYPTRRLGTTWECVRITQMRVRQLHCIECRGSNIAILKGS